MKPLSGHRSRRIFSGGALVLVLMTGWCGAAIAVDEEAPWPRVRRTNGHTVTLYLPQVESWASNSFKARFAAGCKLAGSEKEWLGVAWLSAQGSVDHSNRIVTLDRVEITKVRFPDAPDEGSQVLAALREVVPPGARTVSLDYLTTALGFARAAARQGPHGLKHAPPEIIWATNRTVLILIDGEPVLRPVPGGSLRRVINTPALLVYDQGESKFYLVGDAYCFAARTLEGPWSLAQTPPADVAALIPVSPGGAAASGKEVPPRIVVRTHPAELLTTSGVPDYRRIRGTSLQYAADTDNQLFFHSGTGEAYLLISGRWFKAKSLQGPWTHVDPRDLPGDFARIPPGIAPAVVLASVPGTRQAELALLANSLPATATVSRHDATLEVAYDGEPKFKPIAGTRLSYGVNAPLPVILAGGDYYALDNGVWFAATSAAGPWRVATEVPEEIYTIPPDSPVYYATFANVYQAGEDTVEVGYTPGYLGAYEADGTVVYGTGYEYEPWTGDDYYGWGWTWGYTYVYIPWYQWWVWRDWWNRPGGLRSAVIENIYDRWQGRPGVVHYDRPVAAAGAATRTPLSGSGYPALYGRFRGSSRPAPMAPPPNTLALNPYSRPKTAPSPGEIPHGAQLLTTIRQAPGGGRDLYASPDGGVYRRKADGWYRRQAGGAWSFVAPVEGTLSSARAGQAARPGGGNRPVPAPVLAPATSPRLGGRVPDAGFEARAQEIAALEREYYARSLAQWRAQNWRGSGDFSRRPARAGGRRR